MQFNHGDFDFSEGSSSNVNNINLSTSKATTSSDLLNSVRAQRLAREEIRKKERSAILIQKNWRRFSAQRKFTKDGLDWLERDFNDGSSVVEKGRRIIGVLSYNSKDNNHDQDRMRMILLKFCEDAGKVVNGRPAFMDILINDEESYRGYPNYVVLGLLSGHVLQAIIPQPTTTSSAKLFNFLELVLDPRSYASMDQGRVSEVKDGIIGIISGRGWVEGLVQVLEKLVAASLPKKKHPHLQHVIRLLTAPFSLSPSISQNCVSLIEPLINHLLAVPALPQSLPIPSLTHLSSTLPIFTILLPYAAAEPSVLSQGKLSNELGKTYFLANLATFGLTGGLLSRYGSTGAFTWIKIVSTLLRSVETDWAKWVEGTLDEEEPVIIPQYGSEDEDEDEPMSFEEKSSHNQGITKTSTIPQKRLSKGPKRQPLPANIRSKLVLFASTSNLGILADILVSPSAKAPTSVMMDYASFVLSILHAFRGTSKWEATLDALMEGTKGRTLVKRIWKEGVRGRWGSSGVHKGWETFSENPSAPCLLLLTHMYCHYLLLTPDDEFFAEKSSNPLSLDEVLEISGIWRDLAFWGYMLGVSSVSNPAKGVGSEETRSLFTRGVTRVSERDARRRFAPSEYWVMSSQMDLRGFVEAAVFEDAELTSPHPEEEETHPSQLPRWARTRQKFTKRQLAHISPRLGLLNNLPMVVPFQTRLQVFQQFVQTDRQRLHIDRYNRSTRYWNKARIYRDSLAEDGFRQLNHLGAALKGTIQIRFYDQFGNKERGIDGGGLFKEFLTNLTKEAFDTNRGLWLSTDQNELYPNPHSHATESHQLSWYGFMGRILGKAIYDGILVDVKFAGFFLAKWLGRQSYLDDLNSLDKDLYKGLIILKNYPKPEDLALYFTVTEQEFGVARSIDLIPGGSDIAVTAENRHEYIQLVCKYKLDRQIALQSRAFFNGLADIIDSKWLRMFDQQELSQLVGGEETQIDLDDLKANSVISGFPNDETMTLFWRVVKRFSHEERRALTKFVTSCARPPLLGFSQLNPKFGIQFAGADVTRLPSASSCFNLLKLPGYTNEQLLREKLLQAINSGAGFDLS